MRRAWDTFTGPQFNPAHDRIGIAVGTYNAKADQHYQSLLRWATYSTDAAHFLERIDKGDYSHADKREFVAAVRTLVTAHAARDMTDDELWRFLRSFVIAHFDFQSAASRDTENAIDRLRGIVPHGSREDAASLWNHLVAKSGELIPAGGGLTRAGSSEQLATDGIPIGAALSFRDDIAAINRESEQALRDIKTDIQGLHLHRAQPYEQARNYITEARFVQIVGQPGTGKSALLKSIALDCAQQGPVFV